MSPDVSVTVLLLTVIVSAAYMEPAETVLLSVMAIFAPLISPLTVTVLSVV